MICDAAHGPTFAIQFMRVSLLSFRNRDCGHRAFSGIFRAVEDNRAGLARPDAKVEFQLACDLGKVEVELDLLAPVASGRSARQCQSRLATRNKYCDHSLVWLRRG